jgi:hypothetical protein
MSQRGRSFVAGAAALLLATAAREASAQGWIKLPNGEYGYVTDYTTTGTFSCGPLIYIGGTCLASGNTLTLGNNGATMTLTYFGTSQLITATAIQQKVSMGNVGVTFGGTGPFTFPTVNPNQSIFFWLGIGVQTSSPLVSSGGVLFGYLGLSPNAATYGCCAFTNNVALPLAPQPPGLAYGGLVFDDWSKPPFVLDDDPVGFTSMVSLTPEPGTLVLAGSGLAMVLGALRTRRRRV